jgi:hypothetical protein
MNVCQDEKCGLVAFPGNGWKLRRLLSRNLGIRFCSVNREDRDYQYGKYNEYAHPWYRAGLGPKNQLRIVTWVKQQLAVRNLSPQGYFRHLQEISDASQAALSVLRSTSQRTRPTAAVHPGSRRILYRLSPSAATLPRTRRMGGKSFSLFLNFETHRTNRKTVRCPGFVF